MNAEKEYAKARLDLIRQQKACLEVEEKKLLEEINKPKSGWFVPEHGQLKRQCQICDMQHTIESLQARYF